MAFKTLKKIVSSGFLLLLIVITPLLISLHFMSNAVQNTDDMSRYFIPLLIFNIAGLVILLVLIIINLMKLIGQYRRREPGSRLTMRMVLMFISLSLPPVGVVYFYSLQFLHQGIDSWFDVKIDNALDDSLELGKSSLDLNKKQFLRSTEYLLNQIKDDSEAAMTIGLVDLLEQSGATELVLMDLSGRIISSSNINTEKLVPEQLDISVLQQARDSGRVLTIVPYGEPETLHVMVVLQHAFRPLLMQAVYALSEEISDLTDSVQSALVRYKELSFLRQSLKFNFSMTLLLVLAFSVFAAVWAAFYSARKLVTPISDIAAGTRAVAAGDYSKQLPLQDSHDELSFLVSSFNTMMRRIAQARDEAAQSQRMVEEQKTYLETVLGHLSSGVMVFDGQQRLQTANRAAEMIFDLSFENYLHQSVEELQPLSTVMKQWLESIVLVLTQQKGDWREEINIESEQGRLILLTRISPLLDTAGFEKGKVVVFDDVTNLIQAQRNAAWGEVARRLAHEIKNPLTPIQLSAERLRHKYLGKMPEEDSRVLDKATKTIVQQVDAMKAMVNAFSDYAKPSSLETKPLLFDALVTEVMSLYEVSGQNEIINLSLNAANVKVEADPVRLRQVILNLVKNALEAVHDKPEQEILIRTGFQDDGEAGAVVLEVMDNGNGFEEETLSKVFEPYVTTKTKGTGLGLAVVKKIIEEHGGMIAASNRVEGGAHLLVRLPLSRFDTEQKD